jgi:hypothetical protein
LIIIDNHNRKGKVETWNLWGKHHQTAVLEILSDLLGIVGVTSYVRGYDPD